MRKTFCSFGAGSMAMYAMQRKDFRLFIYRTFQPSLIMKKIIVLLLTGHSLALQAQVSNQHALTTAGGYQGQIGNYYFEFSLGELYTTTGQGPGFWNTAGIIQPVMSETGLPVTLVSFIVLKSEENTAMLMWTTSQEMNSDRFEIQRSHNGRNWTGIGSVPAAGETNFTDRYYTFSDKEPLAGDNLYRLKMIDRDGTFSYSHLLHVHFDVQMNIYPNPVSDQLHIRTSQWDKVKNVTLLNAGSSRVYDSANRPVSTIEVRHLIAGLYIIRIELADGIIHTQKVIIRH